MIISQNTIRWITCFSESHTGSVQPIE